MIYDIFQMLINSVNMCETEEVVKFYLPNIFLHLFV